ncbi:MAG: tRNA(Ile2) 2-agmatinylcytidine synthetase TiaS [Methanomassiliicoccales archaeon PtaU1.Bin124]|nr:MAG: tRNA(Ile2) 2-agmatinylcytidine synthetase TiaS [Methanomassiliicoccales archaeon PtaU1.Bin124]
MHVAFDDTDSVHSMCTTFLATEVIDALREWDLIGLPRLVRLNPAVPWKTRGNGAVSLRFGRGKGQPMLTGTIRGTPIFSYPEMIAPAPESAIRSRCESLLRKWSRTMEDASPGMVFSSKLPSSSFYWKGVRDIVEKQDIIDELDRIGASRIELEGGRGIIGATCAMSWRPRDRTFEVIAYRQRERWGTERDIDDSSVAKMDKTFTTTFNNFDHQAGRRALSPHTPCPVLLGVRGDDPLQLPTAMQAMATEYVDRWLLWLSNQGTDDHIIRDWRALVPDRSYEVAATVIGGPRTITGGHVVIDTMTDRGGFDLQMTAYEPSKEFRNIVRALMPGDRIRALGELRAEPRTLNLEKLEVLNVVRAFQKLGNPICDACGKSMQSLGAGAGYRCRKCGAKAPKEAAMVQEIGRTIRRGWYEPPVCARRHLSKPLKRQLAGLEATTL